MKLKSLNIIKKAILLERHAKSFYENATNNAKSASVKEFFNEMMKEEEQHLDFLKLQLKNIEHKIKFDNIGKQKETNLIITDELKKQLVLADYELAAIFIATLLEKNAYNFYKNLANTITDNEGKAVYTWLCNWEKQHLESLMELEEYTREQIWFDNNFWPL